MKLAAALLTFLYFFMYTASKDVKLSTGFRLIPKNKVVYEGSTVLLYKAELPTYEPFLSNYTCEFDHPTCEIFNHVYTLAEHTLELLNHSLPHLSDLEDKRIRSSRAIEWFGEPLNWYVLPYLSLIIYKIVLKIHGISI